MSVPLSKACCSGAVPPRTSANPDGYVPKGQYEDILGLKTYVTGNVKSTKMILYVYDIFGFMPQTVRGADLLASHSGASIYMPDLFGRAFDVDQFPPTTEEGKKSLAEFFTGAAEIEKCKKMVVDVVKEIRNLNPNIKTTGVFGLCWGGKIALNAGNIVGDDGKSWFVVSGQAHPTNLTVEDAKGLIIPHLLMPTGDESKEMVEAYEKVNLQKGSKTVWYPDMIHGFMGARAVLTDEKVKQTYEEAYELAGKWFGNKLEESD